MPGQLSSIDFGIDTDEGRVSSFITYAQNFEDLMLWRALRDVKEGFYIDVGAADPDEHSVTRAFYDRGWRGINIEPTPEYFDALAAARPRDVTLRCLVGAVAGEAELYHFADAALSTTDTVCATRRVAEGREARAVRVSVRTLADICREHCFTDIHFLKVDVEGAENDVLRGADFRAFRPWIVLVEATEPLSQVENWQAWEPVLTEAKYRFIWFDGLNRFYLAAEHWRTFRQAFVAPPNCFDHWVQPRGRQQRALIEHGQALAAARQRQFEDALRRVEKLDGDLVTARARAELAERAHLSRERLQAARMAAKLEKVEAASRQRQTEIDALLASTSWRMTAPLRAVVTSTRLNRERFKLIRRALAPSGRKERIVIAKSIRRRFRGARDELSYDHWIARFDQLRPSDKKSIKRHVSSGALPTLLVLACFETFSEDLIDVWLDCLKRQLLTRWQAVLVCGKDCAPNDVKSLKAKTESDGRFTVVRTPLDEADRKAVTSLENAAHILVASSDAILREHTLYAFAVAVMSHPEARLVYSDEDRIAPDGRRSAPWFKPEFSPELLRSMQYLGVCALLHNAELDLLTVVDRVLAEGGVAPFLTRYARTLIEQTVIHVPFILYHYSGKVRQANDSQQTVELEEKELPKVSVIIPTKDRLDLLAPCLASIDSTCYPSDKLEIIVVDNGTSDPNTLCFLSTSEVEGRIRLIRDCGPFNYSRLNNRAATLATGDILVFLNNDTEVIRNDWLRRLVSYAIQPKIGVVGAKLLYPDRTVQHGGTVLGIQGVAGHAHVGIAEDDGGYQNLANLSHEVSAVTGACMAVRRSVFQELGGFDKALSVAFNDVLLCLTAMTRGYRNIFIAESLVIHHESKTRGFDNSPEKWARFHRETKYARSNHRALFKNDPYYNPNLSLERVHDLAWPPRGRRPWSGLAHQNGPLRVLMLSGSHETGQGVAVVLCEQSVGLASRGFEVFVGGPCGRNELIYEGCHRVYLDDPREAACFAFENDVDCVIAHTPPFFSVVRWLGNWPRSIIYDYGEPNPDLFPDAAARREINAEKCFCYGLADRAFAISRSVQAESGYPDMGIIRLGNSHLAVWNSDIEARRKLVRSRLGVDDKLLVLNVCRFHRAERQYKGVDIYADALWELGLIHPDLREKMVFALCGKAGEEDVREMEELGLRVFPNLSDAELIDFYASADVYMNFSRWEGYNLGIGQALALGLPVIASDIPAHREFPIYTSNDMTMILRKLCALTDEWSVKSSLARRPLVYSWEEPLTQLASTISDLCLEQHASAIPLHDLPKSSGVVGGK